jgi:hypothetical protein
MYHGIKEQTVSDIPKAKVEFEKCVLMCSADALNKPSEHMKMA